MHVLFALVVLVLATRFQIKLVDAPIFEIVTKRENAHLVHQVQFTGAVKIQDGTERLGVPVEEVLVVDERVIVAKLAERLVGVAVAEAP